MIRSFALIPWLLKNELRLSWRRQRRSLGNVGALLSPLLIIFLYAVMNIFFAILQTASSTSSNYAYTFDHATGLALLGVWLIMLASAITPSAEMINARGDWELIVSSPISLRAVVLSRILLIAVRALALPVILLTPAINVRILYGAPGLLQFYPALAALSLSAAGTSALIALCMPVQFGLSRTKAYLALAGLAVIGTIIAVTLFIGTVNFIRPTIKSFEDSRFFCMIDWLGNGMFTDPLPMATLCLFGVGLVIAALGPTSERILRSTKNCHLMTKAKFSSEKVLFADSLLLAMIRKEWRLMRRDWRFFLDFIREVIVLSTILILTLQEARSNLIGVSAALSISICAIMANDLSWRMVAVEQLPDLITISPTSVDAIIKCKAIAASFLPLTALIMLTLMLVVWAPKAAFITILFGSCAIVGAVLLNCRRDLLDERTDGLHVKQSVPLVLIQGLNIFSWALGLYFVLNGAIMASAIAIMIGLLLPVCNLLQRRR
ncbi:MAG: hypothetical protein ACREPQ_02680 [Rhodanobacter sp.]